MYNETDIKTNHMEANMKSISFQHVNLTSCYLFEKHELNRTTTINAVYDRFYETGRIGAFDFKYKEGDEIKPHVFWDSDVAKWIEGASYIISKVPTPELEQKIDSLVEKIKTHQDENGYFNIYFTVCEPNARFTQRSAHELYSAGHLIEAAIAYDKATGKKDFLNCMEKYANYIYKVFIEDKSAAFRFPGHEEIELALIKLYRHTGNKKYIVLAKNFLDERGIDKNEYRPDIQAHMPVLKQNEAVGHSVRAVYLYTGMALLAQEIHNIESEYGKDAILNAINNIWEDITLRKMYITGGIGADFFGEAFSTKYDLPSDIAYTETCAGIGLVFFAQEMLSFENNAKYADVIERVLYNGLLSGLSIDGKSFFYENPLEINLTEHIAKRRFPITQRVECFECSCCPPNLNRFLSSIGSYIYGVDGDTLYVNQYIASELEYDGITSKIETDYPNDNKIAVTVSGVKYIALRIPKWCDNFKINKSYSIVNGYAIIENDESKILLELDMPVKLNFSNPSVLRTAGKVCISRGPVVYCAEGIDNKNEKNQDENYNILHKFYFSKDTVFETKFDEYFGLHVVDAKCDLIDDFAEGTLYSSSFPKFKETKLRLIPYNCFANRGESDMLIWFQYK